MKSNSKKNKIITLIFSGKLAFYSLNIKDYSEEQGFNFPNLSGFYDDEPKTEFDSINEREYYEEFSNPTNSKVFILFLINILL